MAAAVVVVDMFDMTEVAPGIAEDFVEEHRMEKPMHHKDSKFVMMYRNRHFPRSKDQRAASACCSIDLV